VHRHGVPVKQHRKVGVITAIAQSRAGSSRCLQNARSPAGSAVAAGG
jgi:hypothetical protein